MSLVCIHCGRRVNDHPVTFPKSPGVTCNGYFDRSPEPTREEVSYLSSLVASLTARAVRAEEERQQFHAGHAIALHMVIEMARQAHSLDDEKADAIVRDAIDRAREVQQWLEPLIHAPRPATP